ncbi:dihydropteroate synthase [Gorillibacterium sp. sgz5001074]|uniref:dihydropteroate synthase n=1 Tax=Gorillibacterium sp. sgz5001074 TaxID=3446695 RepID=UPI003F671582
MTRRILKCRGRDLILGERTLIMGILNVTPDSFSDGGQYNRYEDAVARARQLVTEGADILDIGGESTRPGSERVSAEEELRRVIPVIRAVAQEVGVPISIDTYKAGVARQALLAGAHIINDVWGFKEDPDMAAVAAEFGCPVILMHNRKDENYTDYMADVLADLEASIGLALAAGVEPGQIVLDPGIGFAKDQTQNLVLLQRLGELKRLEYPLLLGTSRKRVIRNVLQLPPDDVVEGTAATVVLGIAQGADIIRVHDVREIKRVALMTDAILQAKLP